MSKIDLEKQNSPQVDSLDHQYAEAVPQQKQGFFRRCVDSFKAPEDPGFDTTGLTAPQIALAMIERSKPKLTKRHLRIITAAGGIGTGLFIGTGTSLRSGGPAALLIGFCIVGVAIICTMCAFGELGVRYPLPPSFTSLTDRFVDRSWGFTNSWMYALCWMIVVPLELIAAAMTLQFWHDDDNGAAKVNPVAWISVFFVFECVVHIIGTKGYGEVEFFVGLCKLSCMIGFIIFAVIVDCGGGPSKTYLGGKYWHDPGAFAHGFKGVITVLVSCTFAYGGTEVSCVAAASTHNPRRAIPSAIRQVMWRVLVFFLIGGGLMIGLLVPHTESQLRTESNSGASPFVLSAKLAGVRGLPSVINAVIIMSVLSVGNAAVFASTRTYVALALEGQAPKFMCYIDRHGRPIGALAVVLTFSLLAFVCASDKYAEVFDWLYAFTALSFLYAWGSICLSHIRHRSAMKHHGVPLSDLLYRSPTGVIGSWIGLGICVFVFVIQFWVSIWPLGAKPDAQAFFKADLSVPFAVVLFIGHKIYSREGYVKLKDIDVTDNIRKYDMDELLAEDEEIRIKMKKNLFFRLERIFC